MRERGREGGREGGREHTENLRHITRFKTLQDSVKCKITHEQSLSNTLRHLQDERLFRSAQITLRFNSLRFCRHLDYTASHVLPSNLASSEHCELLRME